MAGESGRKAQRQRGKRRAEMEWIYKGFAVSKGSASGATRSGNVSCRRGQRRLGCDVRATAHRIAAPSSGESIDSGTREGGLALNVPNLERKK